MKKILTGSIGVLTLTSLMLLTACSAVDMRKDERQAAYSQLNSQQQQLVMQGQIAPGMSKDAVYIALGNPQRTSNLNGIECWYYQRAYTQQLPALVNESRAYNLYDNSLFKNYDNQYNISKELVVRFGKDGKVIDWQ